MPRPRNPSSYTTTSPSREPTSTFQWLHRFKPILRPFRFVQSSTRPSPRPVSPPTQTQQQQPCLLPSQAFPSCLRFLNKQALIIATNDGALRLHQIRSQSEENGIQAEEKWNIVAHQRPIGSLSCMNENHVFTGSRDRSVKAFNVRMEGDHPVEQFVIPDAHGLVVTALVTNATRGWLHSGSRDNSVKTWDISSQTLLNTFQTQRNLVTCMASAADGQFLLQGSEDKSVRIWETTTGENLSSPPQIVFRHPANFPTSLASDREARYIAVGTKGFDAVNGGGLYIWDSRNCKQPLVERLNAHNRDINGCAFLSDERIATAARDGTLTLWQWDCKGTDLKVLNTTWTGQHTMAFDALEHLALASLEGSTHIFSAQDSRLRLEANMTLDESG